MGKLLTGNDAFNAKLASGQVVAYEYVPLCPRSSQLITKRLHELNYTEAEIAEMNPMRRELLAVKGLTAQETTVLPSQIQTRQLYHGITLTRDYSSCPSDAECRRIESTWFWRRAPFFRFTDRLVWSWSRDWVFVDYTTYNLLAEWGCTYGGNMCRGFYFVDNTLWDSVIDNGTGVQIDIHDVSWYEGIPYVILQWQGEAGIDIYKDRSCQGSSCHYVTMTVLQRYYQRVIGLDISATYSKEPSITVTPSIRVNPSYDRTARWRYRDE